MTNEKYGSTAELAEDIKKTTIMLKISLSILNERDKFMAEEQAGTLNRDEYSERLILIAEAHAEANRLWVGNGKHRTPEVNAIMLTSSTLFRSERDERLERCGCRMESAQHNV